jgi:hypothetical protein
MTKYNDWNQLEARLTARLKQFKRMAILTGTQLEEMNKIEKLLEGFKNEYRSDDFHMKVKLACIAAKPQMPVIKTAVSR